MNFAEDKTRLLEFGRFASENCKKNGRNKPETFDFLGFTHYCSKSANGKHFRVKRRTSKKKLKQKAQEFKMWIKTHRSLQLKEIMTTVKLKLIGHYNYYGITDNLIGINKYFEIVKKLLYKWLNRESQRGSFTTWEFKNMIKI